MANPQIKITGPFTMSSDWSVQSKELRKKIAQLTDADVKFKTGKEGGSSISQNGQPKKV